MKQFISLSIIIVIAFAIFIVCPYALIWALNTLFNLHIPHTLSTWLAAAVIFYSFSRPSRFSTRDKK